MSTVFFWWWCLYPHEGVNFLEAQSPNKNLLLVLTFHKGNLCVQPFLGLSVRTAEGCAVDTQQYSNTSKLCASWDKKIGKQFFTISHLYISDNMPAGLLCVLRESGIYGGSLPSQLLFCQAGPSALLPELSLSRRGWEDEGRIQTPDKEVWVPTPSLPHWVTLGNCFPPFAKQFFIYKMRGQTLWLANVYSWKWLTHFNQNRPTYLFLYFLWTFHLPGENVLKSEVVGLNYSFQLNHSTRFHFSPVPRRFQI